MGNDSCLEYKNHLSNLPEGHISRSFKGEPSWTSVFDSLPINQNGYTKITDYHFEKQCEGQISRSEKGHENEYNSSRTNGFSRIGCITDWDFELEMEMLAYRLRDVVQLKPLNFAIFNSEVNINNKWF